MKLDSLFEKIPNEVLKGSMDTLVLDIAYDYSLVKENDLYVALVDADNDGHDDIESAIDNGAIAILVSRDVDVSRDVVVIKVDDTRSVLAKLSMRLFMFPQNKMKTIAVTGTRGKSEVGLMIKKIIETSGKKCGLIDDKEIYIGKKHRVINNKNMESYDILKYMNEMVHNKIEYMVMEVSSKALKFNRVKDIIFDFGVFTNLTENHIGNNEHDSMDDYIDSKGKLFSQCNHGILNIDDEHFYDMIQRGDSSINTYGYNEKADLRILEGHVIDETNFKGIELKLTGIVDGTFRVNSQERYSAYNAMAAIYVCYMLGIDNECMGKALSEIELGNNR